MQVSFRRSSIQSVEYFKHRGVDYVNPVEVHSYITEILGPVVFVVNGSLD